MIKLFMPPLSTNKARIYGRSGSCRHSPSAARQSARRKFMRQTRDWAEGIFRSRRKREILTFPMKMLQLRVDISSEKPPRSFLRWRIPKKEKKDKKLWNKFSAKLMLICWSGWCFAYETMTYKWLYDVTWLKLVKREIRSPPGDYSWKHNWR